jgi:hypothetical protein
MLKNVIGAIVGSQVTKSVPAAGGTAGAVLGSAIPFVLKRLSIPAMVAIGAGGYFYKKYSDKKKVEQSEVQTAGTSIDGDSLKELPKPKKTTKSTKKTPVKAKSKTTPSKEAEIAGSPPAPLVNGGGVAPTPVPTSG